MQSYSDLISRAKAEIRELPPKQVAQTLGVSSTLVIDVREPDEFREGALVGSLSIPRGLLESRILELSPDQSTPIVVYCAGGSRSALAALTLQNLGFHQVVSIEGGFGRWKSEEFPWEKPATLDAIQRVRYSRHTILPEVGEKGQLKLLSSRVLLVGAGGLGSPAALYLAAAGVGTLGIADFDVVDESNLQRQVIHNLSRLGEPKVDSARETITALNPDVTVATHRFQLAAENILSVMEGYDLVVDGGDNFPTRYLVNDASLHLRIPVVYGAVHRFEGQASVFHPYQGPCYRCLFAEPPPPELAPSCAEVGVLGVLPGVIGTIQATEAIKMLLGVGDSLVGRLLTYDGLTGEFSLLNLQRNRNCPACADPDRPPPLVDYDRRCSPAPSV